MSDQRQPLPSRALFLDTHAAMGTRPICCPQCKTPLEGAHDGVYYIKGFVYTTGEFAPDDACAGCQG